MVMAICQASTTMLLWQERAQRKYRNTGTGNRKVRYQEGTVCKSRAMMCDYYCLGFLS